MLAKQTLLIAFVIALTRQACLSNVALNGLGFANLTAQVFVNNSASVCTNIYNTNGACVDPAEVRTFLDKGNKSLKNRIDDGSSIGSAYNSVKNSIKNAFTNSGQAFNETYFDNMRDKASASRTPCLQAYATVNMGLYCLLTSQLASTYATDFTSYVQTSVNATTVGSQLDRCLPLIDSICLFSYGAPISASFVFDINTTLSTNVTNQTCTNLRAYYNCSDSDATCLNNRHQILINTLFQGNTITFVPPKSFFDNVGEFFGNLGSTIKGWFSRRLQAEPMVFTGRRLQAAGTRQATMNSSSDGRDVASDGSSSGVAAPTASSSAKIAGVFGILLLSIFAN